MPTVHRVERHAGLARRSAIGLCQTLALVPGVSRSGATIVGGLLAGLDRPAAAEFSFFLAMPTMAAAFVHELLEVRGQFDRRAGAGDRRRVRRWRSSRPLVVVKPFLAVVTRVGFAPFAWYRIALGGAARSSASAGRVGLRR